MAVVHVKVLERAAEVLGGKAALREVLRVSMQVLERWMLGIEVPPRYAFLRAVDIITEQPANAASEPVLRRAAAALKRSKEIRGQLLESAATQMRSDAASVQLLDGEKEELLLLGWKGFHPDSAAHWQRVPCGSESTCGAALKERQRVIVADVDDPACGLTQEGIACYKLSGLVAVQSTPLVSRDGRLLGMLSTHWRRSHRPAARDLALFDALARQAADALERVHT